MNHKKRFHIDERYINVNLTHTLIIYSLLIPYCVYLSIDNFSHGNRMIGQLALFCAVMTAIATTLLAICRFGNKSHKILMHLAIIIECFVYWFTFGVFLYTGGTGGTSIFLIFAAAPVCFFFFNLFYASIFCFVLLAGMIIYMQTPLRLLGYQFPEMYYNRLPMMYFCEVIMCAVAQYETDRARIKQGNALEEAKRASEAKTDFLANTSHEIRTPINAVLGMNEMILRESARTQDIADNDHAAFRKSFKKIRNYAENVDSAGNNLLSIINDILDFSKIEEGRMDLVNIDYQLSSLLNDVSNMIHYKANDKGLDFIADVSASIPDDLYGDEVRVRQIITNLLTNAVKYTEHGSVTFRVKSGDVTGDLSGKKSIDLTFIVEDTGIGIKKEDVQKLFTKFERVDLEKNSTIEGTGLGLAITKDLLEMMGGNIKVDSRYGEGSVFTVTLPQIVRSAEPIGDFRAKFKKHVEEFKTYHTTFIAPDARVLVVDDTKMNLIVATEFLKDSQMQIDTAASGADAITNAEKKAYDIILMDQRMPGMDGIEAMNRIRAIPSGLNRTTPIICLTADAIVGARERYISKGFTDYITKPIDSAKLETMIKRYLPSEKVKETFHKIKKEAVPVSDMLTIPGVDTAKGLHNCANDENIYRSILGEYVRSHDERSATLSSSLADNDMETYGITVHSLKSTSRTIGADALGEVAYRLEKAAKSGDTDTVRRSHNDMIRDYDAIVTAIISKVDIKEDASSNEDILEFDPV